MVDDLIRLIHTLRLPLSDEKACQAALSTALEGRAIGHERERRLVPAEDDQRPSPNDIVDFLLPSGLAMEVKLKGSARAIYAQLERYCASPEVTALLLVTNRAMGLPREILGKPVYYASLGRAYL